MSEFYGVGYPHDMPELPKDRKTINATNRFYFDTEDVVCDILTTHIKNTREVRFVAPNSAAQVALDSLIEKRGIKYTMFGMAFDYWVLGETFPYTELATYPDVGAMCTMNPNDIRVKKVLDSPDRISLISSEVIDDAISNTNVTKNEDGTIQLDAANISHLKMLASPYDIRGTSVIVSVYEDLERLRSAYFAQEIRKDDSDQGHIDLMIEAIKTKLMFGDEATRQARYADFRLALTEWFEKIMGQVPELAGSTIKFD